MKAVLSVRRASDLLVKFGIDIPQGLHRASEMARAVVDGEAPRVPPAAAKTVGRLAQQALDTHAVPSNRS